jgi:hypothetical protein
MKNIEMKEMKIFIMIVYERRYKKEVILILMRQLWEEWLVH